MVRVSFYPLGASSARVIAIIVCMCVCLCVCVSVSPCVTRRYCIKTCTLPRSPPTGGTKRDFAIFPVSFNFCRIKSATKFLCVKTSSGKVIATSYLYLTVHRWIAGDVPIYQKFALKVTHSRRKTPISLNSAAAIRAS